MLNLIILSFILYFLFQKLSILKNYVSFFILGSMSVFYLIANKSFAADPGYLILQMIYIIFIGHYYYRNAKVQLTVSSVAIPWILTGSVGGTVDFSLYSVLALNYVVLVHNLGLYHTKAREFFSEFYQYLLVLFMIFLSMERGFTDSFLMLSNSQGAIYTLISIVFISYFLSERFLLSEIRSEIMKIESQNLYSLFSSLFVRSVLGIWIVFIPFKQLDLINVINNPSIYILLSLLLVLIICLAILNKHSKVDHILSYRLIHFNAFSLGLLYLLTSIGDIEFLCMIIINFSLGFYTQAKKKKGRMNYYHLVCSPLSPFVFYKIYKTSFIEKESIAFMFVISLFMMIPTIMYCVSMTAKRVKHERV